MAVDAGISNRALVHHLSRFGQTDEAGNPCLDGLFLTHTHKDHVNRSALTFVLENGVRLFAHVDHMPALEDLDSEIFAQLRESGLLTAYTMRVFEPFPHLQVLPLPLSHDCRATHGFVFHFAQGAVRVGYVTDTGVMPTQHHQLLADCDVLALEFNHDVEMQQNSCRPEFLKQRVLGRHGHLSNDQASEVLSRILENSHGRRLRHLALMHLSSECNSEELAFEAAQRAVAGQQTHRPNIVLTKHGKYAGSVAVPSPVFKS